MIFAVFGSSPRIAIDVTDLPDPDSPTIPSVSFGDQVEADVVDRVHDAVVGREVDREVAHREHRLAAPPGTRARGRDRRSTVTSVLRLRVEGVAETVAEEVHARAR